MLCSGLAGAWRPCAQALPVQWSRWWIQPSDTAPPVAAFSFGVLNRGAIWRPRNMTQPSGTLLLPWSNGLQELGPDTDAGTGETNGDLWTDPQPWPKGMRGLLWVSLQMAHYGGENAPDIRADPLADAWRWTLLHNDVVVPGFLRQFVGRTSIAGRGEAMVDGYMYRQRYSDEADTGLPTPVPWKGWPLPPTATPCPIRMQSNDTVRIEMVPPATYDIETRLRSIWCANAFGWMYPEGEDPC